MTEEARPGTWHVVWAGDTPPQVLDQENNVIATVTASTPERALARAGLIAAAPELYEMTSLVLMVLQAMAQSDDENAIATAADMMPPVESVLDGAAFLGTPTPEVLTGP